MKISLNGRSPMEATNVPDYLPKDQKKYFSDALIAYNSGQILAGIFLLRIFVSSVKFFL